MVKISPRYFALSPVSICKATQFIAFRVMKNLKRTLTRGEVRRAFGSRSVLTISIGMTFFIDDDSNLWRQNFLCPTLRDERFFIKGPSRRQHALLALRVWKRPCGHQHSRHSRKQNDETPALLFGSAAGKIRRQPV